MPNLQKSVIITGGNSGLGFECAKAIALAQQGWQIVLACRSHERGMQAVDTIISETENKNVSMLQMDLSSLESVRYFVDEYQTKNYPSLMGLICNAGILAQSEIQYTKEGYELTFGVNHLGHFLLTNLLLSHIAEPGRIIVVSSNTHNPAFREGQMAPANYLGAEKLAHPNPDQEMSRMQRYTTSKLCNLLFAYELDRRLRKKARNITVNGFDPGLSPGTNLGGGRDNLIRTTMRSVIVPILGIVTSTPQKSGEAMARLLLDPDLENVSGKYYQILEEISSSEDSYNQDMSQELWEGSKILTQFSDSDT